MTYSNMRERKNCQGDRIDVPQNILWQEEGGKNSNAIFHVCGNDAKSNASINNAFVKFQCNRN